MEQLPFFQPAVLSVSDLNHALHQLLESDDSLQSLWVQGEISNSARPASGHLYFTLKDSRASLACVMWRTAAVRMRLPLRDGMAVEVHGKVDFYEVGGKLQLNVDLIRPAGEGKLYQEFLRLKAVLEAEGLFDASRKRPLPQFPQRIGIVTSPSGAALQDMLNVLRRRYPLAEAVLSPTPVQGEEAPAGIVAALECLNRSFKPDVILVARGGGSLEDLWAFNDERVVRAIAASDAPVVTGVGHETDFTLADFAADLRAPTPTAAAELATPNILDLLETVNEQAVNLEKAYLGILSGLRWQTENQHHLIQRYSPLSRIHSDLQHLDEIAHRLNQSVQHNQQIYRLHLDGLHTRLASLSPTAVLKRGFALVTRKADGRLVNSTHMATRGNELSVQVSDGTFTVYVSD